MSIRKKQIITNLIYAFMAQGLSFILSIMMSLIVPRVLPLDSFGYWQLFIFYTTYVGIFHFGFNDGIYLINGGKKYKELEHDVIGGAFWISFIVQIILGLLTFNIFHWIIKIPDRQFVILCTIIYMLIFNSSFCLGYIFQAVNETKRYSKSVMVDKLSFMIVLLILLLIKNSNYQFLIIAYVFAKTISFFYCVYYAKDIVFVSTLRARQSLVCYLESVKVGFNLTIAGIASLLILGIGRIVIDHLWGIEEFAKFSLVLSLASFAISFISQVSMVLFPTLRRVTPEEQKKIYKGFRAILVCFLPLIFVICVPLKVVLQLWLPKYKVSLEYFAMAMSICFFDAKMNLLCNTYFKVLREERFLKRVNIISLIFSLCACSFAGFALNNSFLVLVGMVCSVALRSILSEIYLAKKMDSDIKKVLLSEIAYVTIFLMVYYLLSSHVAGVVVVILYIVLLITNRKNTEIAYDYIRKIFNLQ